MIAHGPESSTITAEKDTWPNRELLRSSVWKKIDCYPAGALAPASAHERHGSILSLWSHGKDKNGRDVLHSGDGNVEDWGGEDLKRTTSGKSSGSRGQDRRGSFLSIWGKGKDKNGRDIALDG